MKYYKLEKDRSEVYWEKIIIKVLYNDIRDGEMKINEIESFNIIKLRFL